MDAAQVIEDMPSYQTKSKKNVTGSTLFLSDTRQIFGAAKRYTIRLRAAKLTLCSRPFFLLLATIRCF
jgi:hypothetical protein